MPDLSFEQKLQGTICGIDEAGRGPLIGSVVAACVIIEDNIALPAIDDSKKISEKKRAELFDFIINNLKYGIGEATSTEIDEINILNATMLAMQRSYKNLAINCDYALIDGNKCPDLSCKSISIIKGDSKSLSIAAASIVAKVTRDNMLIELDKKHPEYGFAQHKGYGTKKHLQAIEKYGIIEQHRKSFAPIKGSV